MKQATIALHLPSPFLLTAVDTILSQTREFSSIIFSIDKTSDNSWNCKGKAAPSFLICDAIHTPESLITKARSEWNATIIGIVTATLPSDQIKKFDRTISLYDSAESIIMIIASSLSSKREEKKEASRRELSPREKEIVVGIVKGLSNKEIADKVNLSINTVITHRRNIASKLQIHSTAGLTIYAIVSNLISLEEAERRT